MAPIGLLKAASELHQPKFPSVLLKGLEPHPWHRGDPGKAIPIDSVKWRCVHEGSESLVRRTSDYTDLYNLPYGKIYDRLQIRRM
jgi:hypothetical protein